MIPTKINLIKTIRLLIKAILFAAAFRTAGVRAQTPGSPDPFDPNLNSAVRATLIQPDGKIVVAGDFTSAGGGARNHVARFNADGTLDTAFDPNPNGAVAAMALQTDGKIVLGGIFTSLQPNGAVSATSRSNIARINADGTLDTVFDPSVNLGGSGYAVASVAVQTDGKVLFGGTFTTVRPDGGTSYSRMNLARVNPDGTMDTAFSPDLRITAGGGSVQSIVLQAGQGILVGGYFDTIVASNGNFQRSGIARLMADGSVDAGFDPSAQPAGSVVSCMALQTDGKILLGGTFVQLQPNGAATAINRFSVARVNPDGTLDAGFDPSADDYVYSIAVQADGKVLLGGLFRSLRPNGAVSPTTRNHVARVNADGGMDASFDPNVTTNLGVYFGYVLSVALQGDGRVLVGGYFTIVSGTPRNNFARLDPGLTPLQTWRLRFHGNPNNTGNAANNADPYRTGIPNLTAFAFGGPNQNPAYAASGLLPVPYRNGGNYVMTFTQPAGVSGVTFGAERSGNLSSGIWTPVSDTGSGTTHTFSVPIGTNQELFMRIKVNDP